jgi:hypothetical protein
MRILLVNPQDSPADGPWARERWDLVVDLGWAGRRAYSEWSGTFGCDVRGIITFLDWRADVTRIQQRLQIGRGILVDSEGIDWWQLLAPLRNIEFVEMAMLERLAGEITSPVELRVTRPHVLANELGKLLGAPVHSSIAEPPPSRSARIRGVFRTVSKLGGGKAARIAFDKWDGDYSLRRFFSRSRSRGSSAGKVLLPSAYGNVSRVLAGYASLLPDREFLLLTTRADGILLSKPNHVASAPLSAYAAIPRDPATEDEIASLASQWRGLKRDLETSSDALLVRSAAVLHNFEFLLKNGLRIRDAWRAVIEREHITAVLCADENNPNTRLPVLLAKRRGIPTTYCSHGALDTYVQIRGACSDRYLAKGEMEQDYLVRECGIPQTRTFIGAPPRSEHAPHGPGNRQPDSVVFFSEPYELFSGRTDVLYQELLPSLCTVARQAGRKVVVKLHPFESFVERSRLVERAVSTDDRRLIEVTAVPMSDDLLRRTWFGVTVESSVVVECALSGIPCFLCGWFDLDLYAYGRQYVAFGAAQMVDSPADILRIPSMIDESLARINPGRLYRPIAPREFADILDGRASVTPEKTTSAVRSV